LNYLRLRLIIAVFGVIFGAAVISYLLMLQ
jgi:hypothetical protein